LRKVLQRELNSMDLDLKESILPKLRLQQKNLLADKDSLKHVVHVLEAKKADLLQRVESSRTSID
jgi:hypothetical protein